MEILLTVPRSGSHVFGQMMGARMIVTFRKGQATPAQLPMEKSRIQSILDGLQPKGRYWLHLPYDPDYLKFVEAAERHFLLLRDPRGIILSMAHIIDKIPSIGLNYHIGDGVRLSNLSMKGRIDYLIGTIRPLLDWYEQWRARGWSMFTYDQYLANPGSIYSQLSALGYGTVQQIVKSSQYRNPKHFYLGRADAWRYEFTPAQQRACLDRFGDLIEAWKVNG